jgi:hypothetical protein
MILSRLYGRLGNQAFQISAAIAHARVMGAVWAIPRATNDLRVWPHYFLHAVPRNKITIYSTRNYYNEPRHCYDPLPTNQDLTLNGYFQSEKYFVEAKEEIGNALGFHCDKKDYIAIHVRRGDYVTQFSDKHPALPSDYYVGAVDCFISHGYKKFKVYSDDIPWCKTILKRQIEDDIDDFTVEYSTIIDPLMAMRDMYNAAGFIIANSTFSLFPALLRLDNPIVIAPEELRWYGPANAHLETCDLMPERFIKI